jgi:hypothetical protein
MPSLNSRKYAGMHSALLHTLQAAIAVVIVAVVRISTTGDAERNLDA